MNGKSLLATAVALAWLGCSGSSGSTTTTTATGATASAAATSATGSTSSSGTTSHTATSSSGVVSTTSSAAGTTSGVTVATSTSGIVGTTSGVVATTSTSGVSGTTSGVTGTTSGISSTATSGSTGSGATSSGSTSGTTGALVLCPQIATLLPNDTLSFSVPGASSVTWGAPLGGSIDAGYFIAPATPGSYSVTATVGSQMATADITVTNAVLAVSGTIAYSGSNTGVIYVSINDVYGQSTAIFGPGPFEIRNPFLFNGGFTVQAYMDTIGEGSQNAVDPMGSVDATWSGTSATGLTLTLTDPVAATPPAPATPGAFPGDGIAAVLWYAVQNNSGVEAADHYKLYTNTTPSMTGATTQVYPASTDIDAALVSATNGDTLYFAISGVSNGTEGPLSAFTGAIVVGSPAGGSTLSGTVDLTALTPTGPLDIIVFPNGPGPLYFAQIDSPSGMQAYSVSGLPDGQYSVAYALNQTNSALAVPGNPTTLAMGGTPVTVSGATTAPTFVVPGGDSVVALQMATAVGSCGASCNNYSADITLQSNLKQVVSAVLAQDVPVIGAVAPEELTNEGFGQWAVGGGNGSTAPTVGSTYPVNVTYTDQTTCTVTSTITDVLMSAPTPIAPMGSGITEPVTFSWTAPALPPSDPYTYSILVENYQPHGGNEYVYYGYSGPSSATTAQAPTGTFASGDEYFWQLTLYDSYGNSAYPNQALFTMQ